MTAWVEHLDTEACWSLIAQHAVGRIGVLVDSAPEVYPVNHIVDERTIVFRTDAGNKLRGLERSPSVCFEVDDLDLAGRVGWSVLVKGRAIEIGTDELHEAATRLTYWGIGAKPHWVRIVPQEVTGRRIHRVVPD